MTAEQRNLLLDAPAGPLRDAIATTLQDEGWTLTSRDDAPSALHGLVVVAAELPATESASFAAGASAVLGGIDAAIADALSRFTDRGGSIVLVSPALGSDAVSGIAATSLVQRGIAGLVRGLAVQLGDAGVRSNAVLPGIIEPAGLLPGVIPLIRDGRDDRRGTAQDVADAVAYLASDDAGYITGIELVVDGGLSQCRSSATYALWDAGVTTAFTTAQERTV
jgi:NAD(P)-dependent dehydrogenase (short-subunit alcohol dehydrogenase family)